MQIKKHIPNIITLLNLFCGCTALIFITNKDFTMAFYMVSLGIFLDFFDGFFARLFKVSSPLGLQLDSLADMVTSGVVPGYVMFVLLAHFDLTTDSYLPYLGFIVTMGACYRLANFNIDERQTDSFIGLPTPANALFILSLPLMMFNDHYFFLTNWLMNQWILLAIVALSAYIMNAEIPLFSLKIKKYNVKDNVLQIVFLLLSIILLIAFQFFGVSLIIVLYVLVSIVNNTFLKSKV